MKKAELRARYRERQIGLTATESARSGGEIAETFFEEVDVSAIAALHTFIRIKKFNEIDTSAIYYRLWQRYRDIRTFAPRAELKTGEIESMEFGAATEFVENTWGIREPTGGETAEPEAFDLVIVPLLCFDERGYRVGYGKGFYDRFLRRCRPDCLRVGLSYFPPVCEIADVQGHDAKLDLCITPVEVYSFDGST